MWFTHQETASQRYMRQAKEHAVEFADRLADIEVDETITARALGWVSLAIGATEVAAPQVVEKLLALPPDQARQGAIRALGIRELGHGVSILAEDRPDDHEKLAEALWWRVAGDVLDTACLAKASQRTTAPGQFLAVAAMVGAIGLADAWCAAKLSANA